MFFLIPMLQPSLEVQRRLFLLESLYASFRLLTDVSPSLKKLAGPPYLWRSTGPASLYSSAKFCWRREWPIHGIIFKHFICVYGYVYRVEVTSNLSTNTGRVPVGQAA